MKIRSQVGMVLNLDKCIGCHTCSVTCKNVWTSREGVEYAWFNNVETKPGQGFPTDWENQEKYKGGWIRKINGKLQPRMGNRAMLLGKIFANPHLPGIDDYYEPFDFDYQNLHTAPEGSKSQPIARPRSLITGERMAKIEKGPNWEDDLGGEFDKLAKDKNFDNIQKAMYSQFENTFMMYLPRLCEHCLNPSCVATCPSGAIYKREEDGIVLIDQDKCRDHSAADSTIGDQVLSLIYTKFGDQSGRIGSVSVYTFNIGKEGKFLCIDRLCNSAGCIICVNVIA